MAGSDLSFSRLKSSNADLVFGGEDVPGVNETFILTELTLPQINIQGEAYTKQEIAGEITLLPISVVSALVGDRELSCEITLPHISFDSSFSCFNLLEIELVLPTVILDAHIEGIVTLSSEIYLPSIIVESTVTSVLDAESEILLPQIGIDLLFGISADIDAEVTLPTLIFDTFVEYDINNPMVIQGFVSSSYGNSEKHSNLTSSYYGVGKTPQLDGNYLWGISKTSAILSSSNYTAQTQGLSIYDSACWGGFISFYGFTKSAYAFPRYTPSGKIYVWEGIGLSPYTLLSGSYKIPPYKDGVFSFSHEYGNLLGRIVVSGFKPEGRYSTRYRLLPWETAIVPLAIWPKDELPIINPPTPSCRDIDKSYLKFKDKLAFGDHVINFKCFATPSISYTVIPTKRFYIMLNSISLTLLDGTPIEVNGVSVSINTESWSWSFSGDISPKELHKIEPSSQGMVEVILTLNGVTWNFIIESYDESRSFGDTSLSITGRSTSALLSTPYALKRTYTYDDLIQAYQVVEAEIVRAQLANSFLVDWNIATDNVTPGWTILGGALSYSNLSPMEVINRVVQASGGYVNTHPSDRTLLINSKYPKAPWDWGLSTTNPDIIIPKAVIKKQSLKWEESPYYNSVFLSGENYGVTAYIKRAGTAGERPLDPITDPIINDEYIARERGRVELSGGGKKSAVTLDLPFHQSLGGLIRPGLLAEIDPSGIANDTIWRGITRSVSIRASWGNGLEVSQSITLERHY